MKRLALVAAVLAVAACGKKDETVVDTTSAMTPAPAATPAPVTDSAAMAAPTTDSAAAAAPAADTTHK